MYNLFRKTITVIDLTVACKRFSGCAQAFRLEPQNMAHILTSILVNDYRLQSAVSQKYFSFGWSTNAAQIKYGWAQVDLNFCAAQLLRLRLPGLPVGLSNAVWSKAANNLQILWANTLSVRVASEGNVACCCCRWTSLTMLVCIHSKQILPNIQFSALQHVINQAHHIINDFLECTHYS